MTSNVAVISAQVKMYPQSREAINRTLVGVTLEEFLCLELPIEEHILAPWLCTRSMNMLHAKRGVGKTHFGLSIAYAVATGGNFLKWHAPKARKVCYLDGEMSAYGLQERLRAIREANPDSDLALSNLKIYTPDQQIGPILDISDISWHSALEEFIGDADIWLQVDGGISLDTIETARAAGADTFVAGSAVFKDSNPGSMVDKLRAKIS